MDELNMSDLIAKHNELALALGREPKDSFKSLGAAQAAITKLEALSGQGSTMSEVETDPATQQEAQGETGTNPVPFDGGTPIQPQAPKGESPMNSVGRRGPTQGVGDFCKKLILEGKTNAEILEAVGVEFKGTAKTSNSCIAFYRNALKGGAASRPRAGSVAGNSQAIEAKIKELQEKLVVVKKAEAEAASKPKAPAKTYTVEELTAMLAAAQAAQQAAQAPAAETSAEAPAVEQPAEQQAA